MAAHVPLGSENTSEMVGPLLDPGAGVAGVTLIPSWRSAVVPRLVSVLVAVFVPVAVKVCVWVFVVVSV
jgi:hypothetical protein